MAALSVPVSNDDADSGGDAKPGFFDYEDAPEEAGNAGNNRWED